MLREIAVTASGNKLEIVGGELRAPPYPPDIRAKGWPFDLDLEQIRQSTTWKLAERDRPDLLGTLLLLWAESWSQVPCGSLPASDDEVALILRMKPEAFAIARSLLMRGWVKHSDDRLYHRVVSARVMQMMGARRRDRERKALVRLDSDGFQRIPTDSAAASASASASASENQRARDALPVDNSSLGDQQPGTPQPVGDKSPKKNATPPSATTTPPRPARGVQDREGIEALARYFGKWPLQGRAGQDWGEALDFVNRLRTDHFGNKHA